MGWWVQTRHLSRHQSARALLCGSAVFWDCGSALRLFAINWCTTAGPMWQVYMATLVPAIQTDGYTTSSFSVAQYNSTCSNLTAQPGLWPRSQERLWRVRQHRVDIPTAKEADIDGTYVIYATPVTCKGIWLLRQYRRKIHKARQLEHKFLSSTWLALIRYSGKQHVSLSFLMQTIRVKYHFKDVMVDRGLILHSTPSSIDTIGGGVKFREKVWFACPSLATKSISRLTLA